MYSEQKNPAAYGELVILALDSFRDFGEKVNEIILRRYRENIDFDHGRHTPESFLAPVECVRFSSGEGKVRLPNSVRGKDVFILCDKGNYSCTYDHHGYTNHMGPDEHFADIKRVISAIGGKSRRTTVLMPLLYASRQDKRKSRESLDCAMALQELENMGVKDILTFDVHNSAVQNAIPLASFENLYPTYDIVKSLMEHEGESITSGRLIVISPDTGAMDRAIYYASVLDTGVGLFYKRRDYARVINGTNPIIEHEYMGPSLNGMDALIVDDLVASGDSIIDVIVQLRLRNVRKVFVAVTFTQFTSGVEKLNECYEKGLFHRMFSTNLTYVSPEVKAQPWYLEVDMAEFVAKLIDNYNFGRSVAPLLDMAQEMKSVIRSMNSTCPLSGNDV
ncbi:MAG: ribose-phosphate pyrophosphokinase [Defluviitaleaceae bacterium]|nr:ribose-phosphate pyrophosphokinase [Defluviitaleaceae bacterium]